MKDLFRRALKIYQYLAFAFTIGYFIYVTIDDWLFIENYWDANWMDYLGIWCIWYAMYFIVFSFYYWIAAAITLLFYQKIVKPLRARQGA